MRATFLLFNSCFFIPAFVWLFFSLFFGSLCSSSSFYDSLALIHAHTYPNDGLQDAIRDKLSEEVKKVYTRLSDVEHSKVIRVYPCEGMITEGYGH